MSTDILKVDRFQYQTKKSYPRVIFVFKSIVRFITVINPIYIEYLLYTRHYATALYT